MNAQSRPTKQEVAECAQRLIAQYGWQSVKAGSLMARVLEHSVVDANLSGPYALQKLCERAAAEQLYAACERGVLRTVTADEKQRWEQAYQDLGNWLHVIASRMHSSPAPGVPWQDVVQNTLVEVHAHYAGCKDPQSFLGFAATILERQRIRSWREFIQRTRWETPLEREESLDNAVGDSQTPQALITEEGADSSVLDYGSLDQGGEKTIFTVLGECLRTDDQRILALGLLFDLKRREIMRIFGMAEDKFDNVRRTLKARLRQCGRAEVLWNPRRSLPIDCKAPACPVSGRA